jgi:hypothetical protein
MNLGSEETAAFDRLLAEVREAAPNALIEYTLAAPKWQFLCHLADRHGLALHGTGDPSIGRFEPRRPNDLNEFGAQNAVYAARDGLWPMYYAVLDRVRFPMSLCNACIRIVDDTGRADEPRYFFAISDWALVHEPWRAGFVYLLPPATFVEQPPEPFGRWRVLVPQLASHVAVEPLARLRVAPSDFPFLSQIRPHDDRRAAEVFAAMRTLAPLPE